MDSSFQFSTSSLDKGCQDQATASRAQSSNNNDLRGLNVFCSSCRLQLGYFNSRTSAVTLFKLQLLCATKTPSIPGVQECLAAALIATAARSGSSKALIIPIPAVHSGSGAEMTNTKALHVWLLNSNIRYTSTEREEGTIEAIKFLFRVIETAEAEKMLENVGSDAQEVNLPGPATDTVMEALESSNALLPPTQRQFQHWNVGLLERGDAR